MSQCLRPHRTSDGGSGSIGFGGLCPIRGREKHIRMTQDLCGFINLTPRNSHKNRAEFMRKKAGLWSTTSNPWVDSTGRRLRARARASDSRKHVHRKSELTSATGVLLQGLQVLKRFIKNITIAMSDGVTIQVGLSMSFLFHCSLRIQEAIPEPCCQKLKSAVWDEPLVQMRGKG